ncbi:MAG: DUF1932 domain-containing protein [Defluviicoccus sp.]|nr:DUF1932 domain-containing protein [Defluviicoccus sp.]
MTLDTVAILSPGEMGGGVGAALRRQGRDVLTCLAGRGGETRARAERLGFRLCEDLDTMVAEADIVLSILPPEAARAVAEDVAAAMRRTGKAPPYAELNAIAPDSSRTIEGLFRGTGANYIDGGIVGLPPAEGRTPTRIYVSGNGAPALDAFDGKEMAIRQCGPEIGRASSVKMCYASVSKGTNALHTAAMTAADSLGVGDILRAEIADSVPAVYERMEANIPRLPADSGRWVREMEEIAKTYASAGLPSGFHLAAAEIFRLLDTTPYGSETRETMDRTRTMEQTVAACGAALRKREAAE